MQRSEVAEILTAAFVSAWPTFEVTAPTVKLWAELFHGVDKEVFWEAMKATLKTHTGDYPPTPGKVHETLFRMREIDELTEGEAWELLLSAVQKFGYPNPAIAREYIRERGGERMVEAVRALGWQNVCAWQLSDEPANRAHFWRIYQQFRGREQFKERVGIQAIEIAAPRIRSIAAEVVKQLEAK